MSSAGKFLAFLIISLSLPAQIAKNKILLKDYEVKDYKDKSTKPNWILRGKTGVLISNNANLNGVTMFLFDKGKPLVVKTPQCNYDVKKKTCNSKEKVSIKGESIDMKGKGFDIDNDSKKIYIRSKVHVIWKVTDDEQKKDDKKKEADKKGSDSKGTDKKGSEKK